MVTKTKYPGICNNCGKRSEFYIRCGIHTLQLCGTCLQKLKTEAITLLAIVEDHDNAEYNNSVETGLIRPCHNDGATCNKHVVVQEADNGKVPPTGGVV